MDAALADPESEVYDAEGFVVTPHEVEFGGVKMQSTGTADPDEAQRRVLAELRTSAEEPGLDEDEVAAIEAVARWLDVSPDFECTLHGLGLADVTYNDFRPGGAATRCITCNPVQRFIRGTPPCCPKR